MCNYANIVREKNPQWPLCNRPGTRNVDRPDLDPNKQYKMTDDTTCSICDVCDGLIYGRTLKVDTGDGTTIVPLSSVRPYADKWVVSLVAIRQDRHYLPKSLVFSIYKQPALAGFRTNFTKFVIKKTQHLTTEEFNKAKRSPPKDDGGGPTMGHTYVVLSLYKGQTLLADYSFGYFPDGVENPDNDAHHKLTNEERLRIDFTTTKNQWDAALDTVNEWRTQHRAQDYDLFGKNCTAFTRDVISAAGLKFPGDKILSMGKRGLGMVDTPNKTYKAMQIGGLAYDPNAQIIIPSPQPNHVVSSVTTRNSLEYARNSINLTDSDELSQGSYTFAE